MSMTRQQYYDVKAVALLQNKHLESDTNISLYSVTTQTWQLHVAQVRV